MRTSFAELIGCRAAEVAIADNTSRAANLIVSALRERPGTEVLIDQTTYPSSAYPWLTMTGHRLNRIASGESSDPFDRLASAVNEETVAVSVSHVAPETGFRHDLKQLADAAHSYGALLIVDAAQSTGVVPIDVSVLGVDALVTTTMKWLLGPPGVGLAYLTEDLLKHAPALEVGYMGVNLPMSEDWPMTEMPPLTRDGRQLELGVPALVCLAPARAGIELLMAVGITQVAERIEELVAMCVTGLVARGVKVRTPLDSASRSGVVAIEHPQAVALAGFAKSRGVDIGGYPWGVARIDPHAFNDEEDIERLFSAIDAFGLDA